jgi:prepilin-type N-terminal cleavage/methylation domain-containing protein
MRRSSQHAFTLVEMLMTLGLVGILGVTLMTFTATSTRFVARNLATNHSQEATRLSSQTLLKELRDSASMFRLFNADGDTFTEVTAKSTAELDPLSKQYVSNRTNGVRFRQLLGGPFPLIENIEPTDVAMTFSFQSPTTPGYVPIVGDKVFLPLVSREFDIVAVSGAFEPNGTVTVNLPIGYTLNCESPNVITGYFYRRVAFTVAGEELRYHPNFTGDARTEYRVVRGGVTSPKPFSLLFSTPTDLSSDALALRVSMEFTDLAYSARKFGTGTTTLHSVFSLRNSPPPLKSTN